MSKPFYPLLLAAFPILYLLAVNIGQVEPVEAVIPTIVAVVGTAALLAAVRAVLRDVHRAAAITAIFVLGFFLFGHVTLLAQRAGITETKTLVAWIAVGLLSVVLLVRTRRDLTQITRLANVVTVALVVIQVASIVGFEVEASDSTGLAGPQETSLTAESGRRDIYYILVEDYGSPRVLREYMGITDDGLMDWFRSWGFEVLDDTRSNYVRTPVSIASSLDMRYVDDLAAAQGANERAYAPINEMIRNASVGKLLQEQGYRYVHIGSAYNPTSVSDIADQNPRFGGPSDFLTALYDTTIAPAIITRLGLESGRGGRLRLYDATVWQLDMFAKVARQESPKFVFLHVMIPHPPYIFDADGSFVTAAEDAKRSDKERYAAQWAYTGGLLRQTLEPLVQLPEAERPIIVVSTDEGPAAGKIPMRENEVAWADATDDELDLHFSIFAAYLLPGMSNSGLYPTMTPVNSFRQIFNLYFDAGLPLLLDRSYVQRDNHNPYDVIDVTDRLAR